MSNPRFHPLCVKRIEPLTANAAQITFAVTPDLRDAYVFAPGQFITLRANVNGELIRRSYSICSTPMDFTRSQEISVGIKRVDGGAMSTWATRALKVGDEVDVMTPDGRFTPRPSASKLRIGIAAGSGITPILSIMSHTLASEPESQFTLIYGNQRTNTIMFSEQIQDLKDRYPGRVSLVHVLSRQPQEVQLFNGRLDESKIREIVTQLVPHQQIHEAFLCGPEGMIESAERALKAIGLQQEQIQSERFFSPGTTKIIARTSGGMSANTEKSLKFSLNIVLDGKTHSMGMSEDDHILDTALEAGLDLPYACKGGVCCTCRAKVIEGQVSMDKNFTLEQWEINKGFVLTCQARCISNTVIVSYDDR
jgi:ring-1,2-phenylacetyl-CoA epoxidase subunit PaaE